MKRPSNSLLMALCPLTASWTQVLPPNPAGASFGQWNTIVRDVRSAKKFWMAMGGEPIQIDGINVMKFPGVLVFLTPGTPTHASEGTVMNHLGFYVPNVEETAAKWKAAGVRVDYVPGKTSGAEKKAVTGEDVAWVYSPDDLKLELHGYRYIAPDLKLAYAGEKPLTLPIVGTTITSRFSNHHKRRCNPGTCKPSAAMEAFPRFSACVSAEFPA